MLPRSPVPGKDLFVSPEAVKEVLPFHRSLPGYRETPLWSLPGLASRLGISQILVKDESFRFGLNAFKALGASFAIGKLLCRRFGIPLDQNAFRSLLSPDRREALRTTTLITATDGNHGRGVAWTASLLGCRAVVLLPASTREERLRNILALGAEAEITPFPYDDTVRLAAKTALEKGYTLVQDTAWPGYDAIPRDIMQGYTTMGTEIAAAIGAAGWEKPTHLFLQAGVGSFAGSLAGYFSSLWGEKCPKILIVEPDSADCLYRTAEADDGALHPAPGPMTSMMAGLCCGECCPPAWEILKDTASAFITCGDGPAALGMRLLADPFPGDRPIISGESGAVSCGVLAGLMTDPLLSGFRETLSLDSRSRVLLVSTEGATDRENYRRILKETNKSLPLPG